MKAITKINITSFKKVLMIMLASFVYAFSVNCFIVPMGFYSGGILGFSQVIRTVIERYTGFSFNFDISGIIAFFINIPLLLITYKSNGKEFSIKTMFCVSLQTLLLTLIPVTPLITDYLASAIIGGILCGSAIGILLKNGGSSGGVDIIGMYVTKKSQFSVGAVSLFIDIFVYLCAFVLMADVERIIFTLIYASVNMMSVDRQHAQNINSEVIIISKSHYIEIQNAIMHEMRRGVSYWDGYGAYTNEGCRVLFVIVSKYELQQLKKIVNKIDPSAFISVKNGVNVIGNYDKRL